jgi:hypothetical protein
MSNEKKPSKAKDKAKPSLKEKVKATQGVLVSEKSVHEGTSEVRELQCGILVGHSSQERPTGGNAQRHGVLDSRVQGLPQPHTQIPATCEGQGLDTMIKPSYKRIAQIAYDSGITSKEACFLFNANYKSLMRAASELGISLVSNGMGRKPTRKTNNIQWNH